MVEFIGWPKISRFENEHMTITEKLDGTNACIIITESDIYCQSRNRLITPESDNAGFARWVMDNNQSLQRDLGIGRHYGEWWGLGIQRNYGLPKDDKRFSLFNTHKWAAKNGHFETPGVASVPVLHEGPVDTMAVVEVYHRLKLNGSVAVPGFMNPEGVVTFLANGGVSYKLTDAPQGPSKPRTPGE